MGLRLLAVPIAGRDTASSRLRLYDLVAGLPPTFDVTVAPPGSAAVHDLRVDTFDLVYVQKDARPPVLELCRRATDARVPIVYDIDDDFGCWPDMAEEELCKLATVVTVDSDARADSLRGVARDAVVLPCMIDAAQHPARRPAPSVRERIGTVGSFGNLLSLWHTLPWLAAVPPELDTYVVGPAGAERDLPRVPLVPFHLDDFVPSLLRADVHILAHGEREAPLKDNNRLVMAMSLGLPTLVSATPAYLEVLADLGLEWLCCRPEEVPARLGDLADPAVRLAVAQAGWAYAWDRYAPARCLAEFVRVCDMAVGASR